MKVGLLVTCLVDSLFPSVGAATVAVLERAGCEVVVPRSQTCCGQAHINSGYGREAVSLVRNFVATFDGFDAVVAPSGSCVGSVRHQHADVARRAQDDALATRAELVAAVTFELSEFLVDQLGVVDVGAAYPHRVTYHPTCHSLRMLGVGERPLQLLRAVAGIQLEALPEADQCCGFGGTFAVKNAATSSAMLADKLAAVTSTGATVCAASDSSCLMQIGGGLARMGSEMRPVHLAEILASTTDVPAPSRP